MAKNESSSKLRSGQVSLAEIASEAGVSRMTASRVLRGADGYSIVTRDKVLEVANRLGYVPNRIAATLGADTATSLVAIALPTLGRELYSQILEGLESKLTASGYQPIVGVVGYDDDTEYQWLNSALAWRPCGLVVAGRERALPNSKLLRSLAIPVVEIWNLRESTREQRKADPLRVGLDHFAAGRQMGEYLANRYRGPAGYCGVRQDGVQLGLDRFNGFVDGYAGGTVTAAEPGASNASNCVDTHLLNDRSSFYAGYYGTQQLLSANPAIRVLYFLDDNMAVGGLMFCQEKGLKIPGDVAIAGFGGLDIGSILPSTLTTTSAFRLRIGKLAAESLIKRINGAPVSVTEDVGFELIRGETA